MSVRLAQGPLGQQGAAGAFNPADYGTVISWWDASDTATITDSSGAVTQWDDKVSTNNVTGPGGAEPTTNATTINGLNVIDFDGTEYLETSTAFMQNSAAVVIVVFRDTGDNNFVIGEGRTSSTNGIWGIGNLVTSSNVRAYHEDNGGTTRWDITTSNTTARSGGIRVTYQRTAYSPTTDVDVADHSGGSGSTTGVASATFTPNRLTFGALQRTSVTNHITGWIGEIIALSSVTDLAGLEAAIDEKWFGSGLNPASISGLMAWYDGSDTGTHTGTSPVTAVADKSGNGRDLTAVGAGSISNNSNTQNSLPVLTFAGDWLERTDFMFDNGAATIFVVADVTSGTGLQPLVGETNSADTNSQYGIRGQDLTSPTVNQELIWSGARAGGSQWLLGRSGVDIQTGGYELMTAVDDGTNWELRTASTSRATGSYTRDGTTPINKFMVGGLDFSVSDSVLTGRVAEVLIYDSALGSSDIAAVESYLTAKWGL